VVTSWTSHLDITALPNLWEALLALSLWQTVCI
jgi:hypothetical protein